MPPHRTSTGQKLSSVSNRFKQLVELNQYLAFEAKVFLEKAAAKGSYKTKRLGVNWQGAYLYLFKSYIRRFTNWNERKILGAMTHLIAAAHKSVRHPLRRHQEGRRLEYRCHSF